MKKVLCLSLALCLLFSVFSAFAEDVPDGQTVAGEYEIVVEKDEVLNFENLIFEKELNIRGDYGIVTFTNCRFEGDVINNAEFFTRVMFFEGCSFAPNVQAVIRNDVKEATMDYDIPKFILTETPVEVVSESVGGVVSIGFADVTFAGRTYTKEDVTLVVTDSGIVPYTGTEEADGFVVVHWWENGNETVMIIAD